MAEDNEIPTSGGGDCKRAGHQEDCLLKKRLKVKVQVGLFDGVL